jgi:hypothetical protein
MPTETGGGGNFNDAGRQNVVGTFSAAWEEETAEAVVLMYEYGKEIRVKSNRQISLHSHSFFLRRH